LVNWHSGRAPEHVALLQFAHRDSLRLLRPVNTLLDFALVEEGRVRASYQPVDLATLTAYSPRTSVPRANITVDRV
jgi:signal transduction histidine kinase